MEPRIKNGWGRAILFMPIWLVIMGLVQGIGVVLLMVVSGVDMANPDSAEALFGEMSFDSPTMLILTVFSLLGSFLALWVATKFIDRKPLMSIGLSVKDKTNEMLIGLAFALAFIGGLFAILWLIKRYPSELSSSQIAKLTGSTKNTVDAIRNGTYREAVLESKSPMDTGLCTYQDLEKALNRSKNKRDKAEAEAKAEGETS